MQMSNYSGINRSMRRGARDNVRFLLFFPNKAIRYYIVSMSLGNIIIQRIRNIIKLHVQLIIIFNCMQCFNNVIDQCNSAKMCFRKRDGILIYQWR